MMQQLQADEVHSLQVTGHHLIKDTIKPHELDLFAKSLSHFQGQFGVRNVLAQLPELANLICHHRTIQAIASTFWTGPVGVVKSLYFDKPPGANWPVYWHQDSVITVSNRPVDSQSEWRGWRRRGDNWAVQPPVDILQQILAVRIHLDAADETNGALRVMEGSHLFGILPDDRAKQIAQSSPVITCAVSAGGIHLFRPLLLHSSQRTSTTSRRVLHLELAPALPASFTWAQWHSVA